MMLPDPETGIKHQCETDDEEERQYELEQAEGQVPQTEELGNEGLAQVVSVGTDSAH